MKMIRWCKIFELLIRRTSSAALNFGAASGVIVKPGVLVFSETFVFDPVAPLTPAAPRFGDFSVGEDGLSATCEEESPLMAAFERDGRNGWTRP